jgi:tRNA(adenine34) deaminase
MFASYIRSAFEEARIAYNHGTIPVGAIVVYNDKIIANAYNEKIINALELPEAMQHAEIIAISEACRFLKQRRLDGCDIYITLEPCFMCFSALILMKIKRVIFGAYDLKNGAISNGMDYFFAECPNVFGGFMEEECASILSSFFKKKRERNI